MPLEMSLRSLVGHPCSIVCSLGLPLPSFQVSGPGGVPVFSQEQAPLALFEERKLGWSETFLPIFLTRLEEGEALLPWKLWEIGIRWVWYPWFPPGGGNGCAENGRD